MLFLFHLIFNIQHLKFKTGPVAEWLGKALQKLLHRFESGRDLNRKRHCKETLRLQ